MRYVDIVLRPEPGWSSLGREVTDHPSVERRAVHQLTRQDDGTAVILYEVRGPAETIRELMAESPGIIDFEVTDTEDGAVFVYAHIDPTPIVSGLLEIPGQFSVVIDTPLEFTADGGLRLTLVGAEDAVRDVIRVIPDAVNYSVESTGEYRPSAERLFDELTQRQQEILLAALRMGYYEQPRDATYEEIADEVGATRTTIGEHLRKAERAVVTGVVPE